VFTEYHLYDLRTHYHLALAETSCEKLVLCYRWLVSKQLAKYLTNSHININRTVTCLCAAMVMNNMLNFSYNAGHIA